MASGASLPTHSAWGNTSSEVQPTMSFTEIMSEELVEQLEEEEHSSLNALLNSPLDASLAQYGLDPDCIENCSDDLALAQALQAQFDREYEASVAPVKEKPTSTETVRFNFESYHPSYDSDYDEESSEDDEDVRELATNMLYASTAQPFPSRDIMKKTDGQLVTKHDKEVTEKRNSSKAMQLPLALQTGDVVGEKLSNRVYNTLRSYSRIDEKRNLRLKDKEEKATSGHSIDAVTRLILFKWINLGKWFDEVNGIIATGKESVVLHGERRADSDLNVDEAHYAIKVYKMTLKEFKNRAEYVLDDYRFKNPRRVLRVWAEKEFMNLHRMKRAGILCPEPISLKKHVMMMSLIGSHGKAAPQLRDVDWPDEKSKTNAFLQVRQAMLRMFKECRLVHGDLSEFNLLYLDGLIYIIDVSQAMDISLPRSLFFLLRDIENVLSYFERIGTEQLMTTTELFNEITGLNMSPDENLLVQVENFEKDNRNAQLRKDKANPADCDLRIYRAEVDVYKEDPAEEYR